MQFQKLLASGLSKENSNLPPNGGPNHHPNDAPVIIDVWEENFEEEFRILTDLVEEYPVIAMVWSILLVLLYLIRIQSSQELSMNLMSTKAPLVIMSLFK